LIDGVTLLLRVRAPPETWTTRRRPRGRSEGCIPRPKLRPCHLFRQRMFKIAARREM